MGLNDAIGRLERAAIDARMCGRRGFLDDGSMSEGAWKKDGEYHYDGELNSVAKFLRCTRPDALGYGGGVIDVHPGAGSHFVNGGASDISWNLNQVRVRIGDIVDPWRHIPNPHDIGRLLEQMVALDNKFGHYNGDLLDSTGNHSTFGPDGPTFTITGGRLPPGIVLNADGTFSGTPWLVGDFTFTATASCTDADGTVRSQVYERSISVVPSTRVGG